MKVARLDRAARIAELARMLGGTETTARKHATELQTRRKSGSEPDYAGR